MRMDVPPAGPQLSLVGRPFIRSVALLAICPQNPTFFWASFFLFFLPPSAPPSPGNFQKNPRVRKIFVRNSGAGNACANFMGAWNFCVLSAGKPVSPHFRNEKSAQRGSCGHPAKIFGQALQILEKKAPIVLAQTCRVHVHENTSVWEISGLFSVAYWFTGR